MDAAVALDAGQASALPALDAGVARTRRSMELRTAFIIMYPEYRGTVNTRGETRLTRYLKRPVDAARVLTEAREQLHFTPQVDGGPALEKNGVLFATDGGTMSAFLPIDGDTVGRVFMSSASLSSQQLSHWLPPVPAEDIEKEVFRVVLDYDAVSPRRADFLTHQLMGLLLNATTWQPVTPLPTGFPDMSGPKPAPDPLDVAVRNIDGTVISLKRNGLSVQVALELTVLE